MKGNINMKCELIKEQLSAYLDKELNPEEKIQVERHLGECPACKKELGELSLTIQAISTLPRLSAPQDSCCEIKAKLQHAHPVYQKPALHIRFFKPAAILTAAAAGFLIAFYALITPGVKTTEYGAQPETYINTVDDRTEPFAVKQNSVPKEFREQRKADESGRGALAMDKLNNNSDINADGAYLGNEASLDMDEELADADENDWGKSSETVYSITVSEQELPEVLLAFQNELDRMNVYQDYDQPERARELFEYQYQKNSKDNTAKEKGYTGGKNAKTAALSVTVELTLEQERKLFAPAKDPSKTQGKAQDGNIPGFGASIALKLEKQNNSDKNLSEGAVSADSKNAERKPSEREPSNDMAVTGGVGGGFAQDIEKPKSPSQASAPPLAPTPPPAPPAEPAPLKQPLPPVVNAPGRTPYPPKPVTSAPGDAPLAENAERNDSELGSALSEQTETEELKEIEKKELSRKTYKTVRAKEPARKKIKVIFVIDKTK